MADNIVELISRAAGPGRRTLLLAASVSGFCNTLILALFNALAREPERTPLRLVLVFVASLALYAVSARYTAHCLNRLIEKLLQDIKVRVVDKIRRMDLQGFERLGTAEIYDRITENVTVISSSSGMLSAALQSVFLVVCASLYLASLSPHAFVLIALMLGCGGLLFRSNQVEAEQGLMRLAKIRVAFFELLTDLLKGFKETRFSARRSQELREDVHHTAQVLREATTKTNNVFEDNVIFITCTFYATVGVLVFTLPQHVQIKGPELTQVVAALMFNYGSLATIIHCYSAYVRSNHALAQISALEKKLEEGTAPAAEEDAPVNPWPGRFSRLEVSRLEYAYLPREDGGAAFHIGPVDLTLQAGEVLFIVGGNGSGKSTFLKVLTGLYPATSGSIRVDGVPITDWTSAAYRELICTIFTDFHLFSRLYGLLDVRPEAVQGLIAQMELSGQTSYAEQRFTRRELSTGQRKRLAMIVALLEDRPIYVFDEWAADQDPVFRHYFYMELLPLLRQRGKTVIAVSHDDRYFACADRVLTMEYGQVRSIESHPAGAPTSPPKTP